MRPVPFLSILAVTVFLWPAASSGQESPSPDTGTVELQEMVVLGTRLPGVSYEELAVPVDVYEIEDFVSTGTVDLATVLQKIAPSFNSKRNALGDGGLFHTAVLRGMSPDHTLLLINGKRRHAISFPRPLDQTGQGTTGYDLRAIPVAAIERIEVLRDGAAAQYGSDAIGGVINIVLKENPDETTASAYTAITQEGDGERYSFATNIGLPLLENGGSANLTVERTTQGRTDRTFDTSSIDGLGVAKTLDLSHIPFAPHDPPIGRKVVQGEPEHDNTSVFLNLVAPAGANGDLYAFGGWSLRSGISSGGYRDPTWSPERMVGPVHPDGFLPFEISESEDSALTLGYRASLDAGDFDLWDYDISLGFGSNSFDFGATDSINASWAAAWLEQQLQPGTGRTLADITPEEVISNAGPRSGDSGGVQLQNWALDFDLNRTFVLGQRTFDAAFGAEYRHETFRIRPGDPVSYICGTEQHRYPDPADPEREQFPAVGLDGGNVVQLSDADGNLIPASCGHQGYPGYSPANATFGAIDRSSHGLWLDVRHDISERWAVETALRWENHDGAGDSLTGKAGTRFDTSPQLSLRAAASTGFRAPSLPQRGFNSIGFQGTKDGRIGVTANLEEGAARQNVKLGPGKLDHESSRNLSAGFVWTPSPTFSLSADAYRIDVDDRIVVLTADCGARENEIPVTTCVELADKRDLPNLTTVQFFDNAADTRTVGLDIVARHEQDFGAGTLALSAALHFNRTGILQASAILPGDARSFIEYGNPRQQHRLAASWDDGTQFDAHVGLNYFGKAHPWWFLESPSCPGEISPAWIASAEVGWRLGRLRLAAGADNLLDEYPDPVSDAICSLIMNNYLGWGIRYSPDTSYGVSGRIWYLRLDATF